MCNIGTDSAVKGEEKVAKKRSKNPGVRVIGGRIYDSENGKTCHQCRQKTRDFAAFCKTVKKVKSCALIFCRKCLLNRYGEKAEEVDKLDEWSCPRCREICNCSFCMKRKGQQPTGILVHAAKATGFNSVQELLQNKGFEALEIHNLMKDADASPIKSPLSNKVLTGSKRKYNDKNQSIEENEAISIPKTATKKKKGPKKVKSIECGESQVPTADQAKPSKLEAFQNCHTNDSSQTQKIAVQSIEKDGAISIEKVATREKKGLKKVKLTECAKSRVPTATQAKPSELDNYLEKLDASDTSQTKKITVQSIKKDEAISIDKVASREKNGLKKFKLTECGVSPVPTANHAKPSTLEKYFKKSNARDSSQTQKIAVQSIEQNEAMSIDKMESRENKSMKINKLTECGESQVPTANQAKSLQLETYFKNCHATDTSQTQKIAVISKVSKLKIGPKHNIERKKENIALPLAKPLSEVAEHQFPAQDVGAALQFLEFCKSFSEILDIKKGQPECILRDITKGHARHRRGHSALAQFCIKLLDLIYNDVKKDGDGWLRSLKTCIEESECELKELSVDSIKDSYGFESLEQSQKLLLLNFLCDEVLLTEDMRKFIDEAEAKLDEKRKEAKQKVADARKQEKVMKQKAKDEIAKTMLSAQDGKSLSISELDEILLKLKNEAEKAHTEVSTFRELKTQNNQRADAVRTDPVTLESNGKIFWKLNSYGNRSITILQEIGSWDSVTLQDKWFVFNEEEKKAVEEYVHSLRASSLKKRSSDDAKGSNKADCQASEAEGHIEARVEKSAE